jgi:hypothetical protein
VTHIKVTQKLNGGWKWEVTFRPPQEERIWVGGTSLTKWGAQRAARRELHRLLEVTHAG